ncbi:thioredoxin [bacterium]|nr:MAG: thioredoxin [bacterium]
MAANLAIDSSRFQDEVLNSDVPVLVDFWAPWCGPCRAIAPAVEQLSQEYAGKAKVVKVDVDENSDLATQYGIQSIPALLVFKGGRPVNKGVGNMSKAQLAGLIDSAL